MLEIKLITLRGFLQRVFEDFSAVHGDDLGERSIVWSLDHYRIARLAEQLDQERQSGHHPLNGGEPFALQRQIVPS
ncbi:hypothetical protein D3C80_1589130 [compost metagenome]